MVAVPGKAKAFAVYIHPLLRQSRRQKVIPIPPIKPGLTSCQGRRMESLEMLHELRILLELQVEPLLWNLHDLLDQGSDF